MNRMWSWMAIVWVGSVLPAGAQSPGSGMEVIRDAKASWMERLAAQEIRRYVYVRTGTLLNIRTAPAEAAAAELIVVGSKDREIIAQQVPDGPLRSTIEQLSAEQYLMKSVTQGDRTVLLLVGGDDVGTLYAAYQFAEQLGVRFYLHGDVIPDQQVPLKLTDVDQAGQPLFKTRGIQPFHDFPEGPDWWDTDAYKAILAQLPKMRMNFFGLHTYPEGGVGPGADRLDRAAQRNRRGRTSAWRAIPHGIL